MNEFQVIPFLTDDGEQVEMYVLEQTTLSNIRYLLVTDDVESESADAYIMKELADESQSDDMSTYEMVEDEKELAVVSKVFEALLDDIDIIM